MESDRGHAMTIFDCDNGKQVALPDEGWGKAKCPVCGHLLSEHSREIGCTIDVLTDQVVDLDCDTICSCVCTYTADGCPDGFVGDHDGEEETR